MTQAVHTVLLILHVLGATVIIGGAFVTLLIEIKDYRSKESLAITEHVWKIIGPTLGLQLLTGLLLASQEWAQTGKNPYFWLKLFLFFIVGGITGNVNRKRFRALKEGKSVKGVTWPLISFITFILIAIFGILLTESH